MEFILREFKREDFEILWDIDQKCFPPGISYSRIELAAYIRHRGSLTLVAESTEARREAEGSPILGFIVAEVDRRGMGHIITIDVLGAARRFGIGSSLLAAAEDRLRRDENRDSRGSGFLQPRSGSAHGARMHHCALHPFRRSL